MGLFQVMRDLGIAPVDFVSCITALVILFVLRATAQKEMQMLSREKEAHVQAWTVYRSYIDDGNYVHGLYEEYKYVGHNSNEAHKLMQKDIKGLKIGHLYRSFDTKPTLVTSVLMLHIGGNH